MVDIKLLGTSGMMPLLERYLTSLLVKFNGSNILIDCGEATQLALRNADESSKDIDTICITHFHADHVSGLIGMLLLMGNQGKTSPLTIIGPKGIKNVVESMRVIVPVLPYEMRYIELTENKHLIGINELNIHTYNELKIKAFKVKHKINCYGYSITVDRLPKFDVEKALRNGIEKRYWGILQHGENVEVDGKLYTPSDVLGEARNGLKVTYVTDSRPCNSILENAKDSDLFICEAMYGDVEKKADALDKKHMMLQEAVKIARDASVKELWLTHFSPSMAHPENYTKEAKQVFENTVIPKCGQHKELKFED